MSVRTVIEQAILLEKKRQKAGDKFAAVRWGVYARVLDLLNAETVMEFDNRTRDIIPRGGKFDRRI